MYSTTITVENHCYINLYNFPKFLKYAKVIALCYTTKLDRLIKSKTVRGAWRKIK